MIEFECSSFETLRALPQGFFKADVETVARALIGVFLFNLDQHGTPVGGRIVETEAYCEADPAAHCLDDKPSPGTRLPRRCR